LFVVFVVLLSSCGRHRDRKEVRLVPNQSETQAVAPPQEVTKVADAGAPAPIERPSPFLVRNDADRQAVVPSTPPAAEVVAPQPAVAPPPAVAPAPALDRDTRNAKKTVARKPLKPFALQTADISHDRVPQLPGPPALPTLTPNTSVPAPFRDKPVVGTATLQSAKPGGLKRVLGALRIHQKPEGQEGFTAAKPARDITLVLPPETRSILRQGSMDLKATVDETGHVTRVQLLAPKDEELIRLAAYAAGSWPFAPARLNDKPVPSEVLLHFDFGAQ
jgi:hypothetical protein